MATLTYHGHSAVELILGGKHVWIDPFLTGNPLAKADPAKVKADLIVLTHGHSDHVGDAPAISQRTGAPIAAAYELALYCQSQGAKHIEPTNIGGTIRAGDISVTFTQAWHSSSIDIGGKPVPMGPACGVVLRGEGKTIYHMGDTGLFSDIKLITERHGPFDLACIPCGDRFTMGLDDAVLAAQWIQARLSVPIHHSTFPIIEANGEAFARRLSSCDLKAVCLPSGGTASF